MNWLNLIKQTIDYIEEHLLDKIDYIKLSKQVYSSNYHFQRMFGITLGITLGEYIRRRRLTLAGQELLDNNVKVIDIAYKYGYDTPESFSRAFNKFHGVLPSQVKQGRQLKSFPRFTFNNQLLEGTEMTYKIQEKPEIVLVGYKKRFTGVPYGEERVKQEEEFLCTTRAKQWLLLGASCNYSTDYMIITNVDEDGYDFYVAYELDEWTKAELFNPKTTGVDFIDKLGFETLIIPKHNYAVFETEKKKRPIPDYTELRKRIITEWLPTSKYVFANAPEIIAMHWRPNGDWSKERYIEICLPIETNG